MEDKMQDEVYLDVQEEKILDGKKTLSRTQKIWIIAVSCALVVAIVASILLKEFIKNKTAINNTDFNCTLMNNSVKQTGAKLSDMVIPESEDSIEMKELAISLYSTANYNLKNDSKVAFAIDTVAEVIGVPTCGYRYYVKNGSEFWNSDYFYIEKSDKLGSVVKLASAESTYYAYRKYYNTDLNFGWEQKSKEIALAKKESGAVVFGTNWDNLYFDQEASIPKEFASSDEECEYCSYLWDVDTISKANITYNESEGYYTLSINLDCSLDKTLGDSLKYLIAGTGDSNARYTNITQTVEIWDNGRFKKFYSYDEWKATVAILKMESANDYKTNFYYDDYSLNISNYQYAEDFVNIVKEKAAA